MDHELHANGGLAVMSVRAWPAITPIFNVDASVGSFGETKDSTNSGMSRVDRLCECISLDKNGWTRVFVRRPFLFFVLGMAFTLLYIFFYKRNAP
jgi:hypothetical protein